jgi:hypothetical protein
VLPGDFNAEFSRIRLPGKTALAISLPFGEHGPVGIQ